MAYIPVTDNGALAAYRLRLGPRTIGGYLTAYGLAIVTPILLFSGVLLHGYVSIESEQLEHQLLQTARLLRLDVDRELGGIILSLETLAASPSLETGDYARFHTHAAKLARVSSSQYIVLSNTEGQPLVDTRVQWGEALPSPPEDIDDLVEVIRTKQPHVSDMLPGQSSFTVTVPVLHDADAISVLTAALNPAYLTKILETARLPEGWSGGIVDSRGRILAQSRGFELDPAFLAAALRSNGTDHGRVEYVSQPGPDRLQAIARSNLANWFVTATITPALALPHSLTWHLFAAAGGTLLALSLLLALYFGRRLATPIRMTALAATALGKGEAMPSLALHLREVDEVLSALKVASAQRRLAEDQLRIAHERMTLALSATEMGMWERDLATNHVIWSEAMYRIFGRTPEEFTGDPDQVLSFVHPEDRMRFRQAHLDAVRGPADTFEQEFRIIRPSGSVRWLYRRAFVRRKPDGAADSVLGVAIDITERKEAEDANAQLAAIVASSSEAILSVSPDGIIATWNSGAEQTFTYTAAEAVGMPLRELFAGDRNTGYERIRSAMAAGETLRLESFCRTKDGHVLEVAIVANPVRSSPQAVSCYSITIRDISARKKHDRHLANVMRELTHRSKNLLAIIQAMARQTALRSDGLADFESRFSGRLQSLSRSHELLISNDWEGALLSDLVAVQRSAFGTRHSRIRASGPDVFLRPEAILNIGLALHELASNAERHGALSAASGRVDLSWSVERGSGDMPRLMIVWRERGRQSAVALLHRGFGRDVLEHVAPTALNANVVLKAIPDGLLWTLDVPGDQFARDRVPVAPEA